MTEKQILNYDMIILGGGPAGLSAAIYATRGTVKTAIIDISMIGGQPANYLEIENYPGFSLSGGFELMEKFEEHADKFGVDKFPMEEIAKVELDKDEKIVETTNKIFKSKAIVLATGAKAQKLGIPGETELAGRGVSYCAVCDGAFFKEKVVTVVGGGNAAVEEALYLTKFASKVRIIHRRDQLRADKILQDRAFSNPKLEIIWDTVPLEIKGEDKVSSIMLKNVKTNEIFELTTDGVFPYIGFAPNSELFNEKVNMDKTGFIITDINLATNLPGVYAAGDMRVTPLRQVITATADGAIAATSAIKYLETIESRVLKG
ncbi:MAG: thioredoxin-disulfide reductase [Candidatus Gastranaerophilaceae bacterium]|jgi:thioredoxin reductase (NADPH)